jgi:hypothetical protein
MEAMVSVADERLYDLLPNGLHDADLRSFTMNYAKHELTLDIAAWVSTGEPRELYRPARVTFEGVEFFCVEPPRDRAELNSKQSVRIDAGVLGPQHELVAHLDVADPINYVSLKDFNSFIFFSANRVLVEWTGPEEDRS